MELDMLMLRLVHFFSGAFWVGVGLFSIAYLTPVVRLTGAEGQSVMRTLVGRTSFPRIMSLSATLAVVTGVLMYWRVSAKLNPVWMESGAGLTLTLGALAGIAGYAISVLVQSRAAAGIGKIGAAIEASGKPPLPEQLEHIRVLQQRLTRGALLTGGLVVLSLAAMAGWRYI